MKHRNDMLISVLMVTVVLLSVRAESSVPGGLVRHIDAGEIYVSPTGNDANPGSRVRPLRTLNAARDLARKKKAGPGGTTICLRAGTYRITEPFFLDGRDSGSSSSPVIYRAFYGETVTLSGGTSFCDEDFKPVSDPAVLKRLPTGVNDRVVELDLAAFITGKYKPWPRSFRGYADWPELFLGDKPLHVAQWPNSGYAKIAEVIDSGSSLRFGDRSNRSGVFRYSEDAPSRWDTTQDIYLRGYWCHKWYDEIIKVASIDPKKKEITMAAPHYYGLGGPSGGLYNAINLLDELDQPGEYVFSGKDKKIYIIPPEDYRGGVDHTWRISFQSNSMLQVRKAKNIRFEGIVFADNRGTAIKVKDSDNIVFENCTVKNISNSAAEISGGSRCGLNRCHIFNIGKTAVSLTGGDRKTLTASGHYLTNSHVHHYARLLKTYHPAAKLSGVGQRVANNYIHNAPHVGVLFYGNDHLIENNRIEKVCLDTSDAGAIYCGRDWTLGGNIIRRNWISRLGEAADHNNWGIYLDDVASGVEVRENILVDLPSGMLIGGGRNNIIADNLIVRCQVRASICYDCRGRKIANKKDEPNLNDRMWVKLNKVPYAEEPWRSRFPYLLKLDNDDKPGMPRFVKVTGNRIYNSAGLTISKYVSLFGQVGDNTISEEDLEIHLSGGRVVFSKTQAILMEFSEFNIGP